MERAFADRSVVGRLGLPFGAAGGRRRPLRSRGARGAGRPGWLGSALLGAGGHARAILAQRRRVRIGLMLALLASALLTGGWMWLRNSPLVSVQRVHISGLHGPDSARIDSALLAAAQHMSTLHLDTAALRAAVAPFAVVRDVRATPEFPHGLRIQVLEQLPVAALMVAGSRSAVAADGVVLGPALLSSALPSLNAAYLPPTGQRVKDASMLASLAVLGAAPAPLARLAKNVYAGPQGLTVAMRNGLLAYFGDATLPHAKWLSLARVLADPSSAGASYVDVRLPARPAAGFPAGVSPPAASGGEGSATSGAAAQPSTSESTVAALAAGLTAGRPGSSSSSSSAAAPSGESSSPSSEATAPSSPGSQPSSSPETTTGQPSEAPASPSQSAGGEASESTPAPGG
jgi:cell division protein FtsQ